jgi:hypothetical protein
VDKVVLFTQPSPVIVTGAERLVMDAVIVLEFRFELMPNLPLFALKLARTSSADKTVLYPSIIEMLPSNV